MITRKGMVSNLYRAICSNGHSWLMVGRAINGKIYPKISTKCARCRQLAIAVADVQISVN